MSGEHGCIQGPAKRTESGTRGEDSLAMKAVFFASSETSNRSTAFPGLSSKTCGDHTNCLSQQAMHWPRHAVGSSCAAVWRALVSTLVRWS